MSSEMRELVQETEAGAHQHRWNDDGERCVKCGDKDWMGGPCSVPDAAPVEDGADLIQWRYVNTETGEVLTPWAECAAAFREKRKDAPGYQFRELFTRPHDASAREALLRIRDAVTQEDESMFGYSQVNHGSGIPRAYSVRDNILCTIDREIAALPSPPKEKES